MRTRTFCKRRREQHSTDGRQKTQEVRPQPHHVNVVEALGAVEEHVANVVADENQHTDTVVAHLVGPANQNHGDNVVEKHHPAR